MKIPKQRRDERGMAVLIVILLLAMMVTFVGANTNALFQLKREIKNVDKRQELRWNHLNASVTNRPPNSPTK